MKLSKKIFYCRKKCGLSQEALANILGVSRQAVSKWETGETTPDITKLALLAKTFHVTSDWLLSEDEPEEEKVEKEEHKEQQEYRQEFSQSQTSNADDWADKFSGTLGKLIKRYGWIYGVYQAIAGLIFIGMGILFQSILNMGDMGDDLYWPELENMAKHNPANIMSTVLSGLGVFLLVTGVILAVYLRKKSKR